MAHPRPGPVTPVLELSLACCRMMRTLSQAFDLSPDEVYALYLISSHHPKSVSCLTRMLAVLDSRTSKILRTLERRGFITRSMSSADRRVENVGLTSRGAATLRDITQAARLSDDVLQLIFSHPSLLKNNADILPMPASA